MNWTLKQLRNLTPDQMKNMTERELDSAIEFMRKSNQRAVRNLGKSTLGKYSPSYQRAKEVGLFSIKGVEKEISNYRKALVAKRHVLTDLISWRNNKTSTASGWKKVREETARKLGLSTKRKKKDRKGRKYYSRNFEKKFWELYEKFSELHPTEAYNSGSPVLMEICAGIVADHMDMSIEEMLEEAENQLYEFKSRKKESKKKNISDLFDL